VSRSSSSGKNPRAPENVGGAVSDPFNGTVHSVRNRGGGGAAGEAGFGTIGVDVPTGVCGAVCGAGVGGAGVGVCGDTTTEPKLMRAAALQHIVRRAIRTPL
jgi:hypothetical protein